MSKFFTCLCLFMVTTAFGQSTPPDNLSGSDLRAWFRQNWYQGKYTELSYRGARLEMYNKIDVQTNGDLVGVYSGYATTPDGTTTPGSINCEHTIPQSFFDSDLPMRSDIHHLFPTHSSVNSARSNYPYTEINDAQTDDWYGVDGQGNLINIRTIPSLAIDDYSEVDGSTFEPREDHKGDIARAIFYFFTMYESQMANYNKSIEDLVVGTNIQVLYDWHLQDPVDGWESQRNDRIELEQGNRNPYVDHPEVVCRAWGFTCVDTQSPKITVNSADFDGAFGVSMIKTLSLPKRLTLTAENLTSNLIIEVSNGFLLSNDQHDYSSQLSFAPVDGVVEETVNIQFTPVIAQDYSGEVTFSSQGAVDQTVAISGSGFDESFIFSELFEDCQGVNQFTAYSIIGDEIWTCTNFGVNSSTAYRMNGYSGGAQLNEDWLVSEEIDLTQFSKATLTFQSDVGFSGPGLELYVSSDFTGEVETANWSLLSATYDSDSDNDTWTSSGDINLDNYTGQVIYTAFKYTSTNSEAARWTLDDVKIEGDRSTNIWLGTHSPDPLDGSNWSSGSVPNSTDDVWVTRVINQIALDGDIALNDIEVSEGVNITIKSGGSLAIFGDYKGSGSIQVNRNITTSGGYSIVSAPVQSAYTDELDAALVYGVSGTSFTEDLSSQHIHMSPGQGFFVSDLVSDAEVTFTGAPNTGSVTRSVTNGQFHLVGNPYLAPIRIDEFLTSNEQVIAGAVYFWDDGGVNAGIKRGGDFVTVNAIGAVGVAQPDDINDEVDGLSGITPAEQGFITSCQGVYVEAVSSGDLVFSPDMIEMTSGANADANYYRKNHFNKVRLKVEGEGLAGETLLGFGEGATTGRDLHLDARKMESDYPLSFYSLIEEEQFVIQGLPVISEVVSVKLYFKAPEGAYRLTLGQLDLPSDISIVLEDKLTGSNYELIAKSEVEIRIAHESEVRLFDLHFIKAQPSEARASSNGLTVAATTGNVKIFYKSTMPGRVRIYNLAGKILIDELVPFDDHKASVRVNLKSGAVYLLRVHDQSVRFVIRD